ncbi:Tetratricopeptide repeat-containing protein [Microbulbifer donghaiensis]|uniref:Tetratricopeptide repeat-containing protein n=1 Tax=Microbulbifer donghaiensis TaxID=494016 RepID=A0A1M5CQL0_9GAMM|nr:sulfotransferase [Microbulbifer donghaiensis]SHF56936.1 Tetratricopeptide repeat-containing protein [Microbulbifer donghaiensis]
MREDQPVVVEKLFQSAHRAMSQNQPLVARHHLEQALAIDSKQAKIWHLLADSHLATQDLAGGISILETALCRHNFTPVERISLQIHLASLYIRADDLGAASQCIDLKAVINLKNPTLAARAGYLLAICEEHSAALAAFETALPLQPKDTELLFNTASTNRAMGNLETAESMYNRALKLAPDNYPAYWLRSTLRKQTEESNHIPELEVLASASATPAEGKVHLYYALAKELEDLKLYEESFSALIKGAELKKNSLGYSVEPDLIAVEEIRKTYSPDTIADKVNSSNQNGEGLIFILGMPRTGSTLVDRILSSNEQVDSAGEPDTFAQIFYRAAMQTARIRDFISDSQLRAIRGSIQLDFEKIGQDYQQKLTSRAKQKNSRYIIDKNPSNFLYLGAIKLALPHAKIIHIKRNPMDTCYAIFKTLFKNGHPYSYDLHDLAAYYSAYDQLMNHWKSIFGAGYFELNYEDLVTTPVETSKALMQYCDLNWSENCLEFHKNRVKGTATASAAQVRQPIYRNSLELWKNCEKGLTPLRSLLKEKGLI